ncbi:hypothetical protein Gasu2_70080 [Galdieria sulphuraria]|uniref:Uncharacterized protein n=1 Tax=Galdieria sulphuraria TaxID=130081 RepID=M2Y9L1_GALSU|nr:uncharacterized protein Gasu_03360 [Galdieria sulphuraria]EME32564.1 hypothetical protein Gasu_03360 [Galdieria sulphuraria]GJD12948.1 hypothetical protein Gasu2_70080 [Galdieria sulphuraria]|eukprot:XP_005709084.1 hypothetical protein Gasu_03360 [Galdieria sulphuraria]
MWTVVQVSQQMLRNSIYYGKCHGMRCFLRCFAETTKETTSSKKKRKGNIVLESLQRKQVEETISDEAYQRESQRMKEYSKFRLKELKLRRKREQDRLEAMRAAILALPEERKREVEEKVLTPVPFELPLFLETPAIPGYDPTLSDEAYQELSAEEVAVEKETIVVDRRRR